jgi:3-hydroxyacyl-CoA dehydrogenase/enoyl-CoA hydratase/3-hydroxybutyryl-CoA epimerase
LTAKKVSAAAAKKMGLVHAAPSPADFDKAVPEFIETVIASPSAAEASCSPRRPLLARLVNNTRFGRWMAFKGTRQRLANQVEHYPALEAAVKAVEAAFHSPGQSGMDVERAEFCKVLFTPTCRNLIGLFFQREKARSVSTWTGNTESGKPAPIEKLGVIGGGAMGAGIAQLAAYQGLEVVLREINQEALDAGMDRIRKLFEESVAKRKMTSDEAAAKMAKVKPTIDWEPLGPMDAVVEAVVEREDIKHKVFQELEAHTAADAVLATNTSSLSVRRLAETRENPDRVAGLHFFNPVHRMELVEVVRTESTSPAAISRLVRLVKKLGKTPIVVEDSPGFVVNRILFPYLAEAVRMVCEGESVTWIDKALKRFGMPMGPLELLDQVGLDIGAHVASGLSDVIPDPGPTAKRLSAMVEAGWLGKKSGQGFYVYENGKKGKPTVWDEAASTMAPIETSQTFATGLSLTELRLVLPIINEAARCLEERIVSEAWMVDLAMVLGTGFAPFRGGPLRLADNLGISKVVADMRTLETLCGDRFVPCSLLIKLSDTKDKFFSTKKLEEKNGNKPKPETMKVEN